MGRQKGSKNVKGVATLGTRTTRSNARSGGDEAPVGRHQRLATRAFTDQWPAYIKNSKRGLREDRAYTTSEEFFGPEGHGSSGPDPYRPKWSDDNEPDLMAEYGKGVH